MLPARTCSLQERRIAEAIYYMVVESLVATEHEQEGVMGVDPSMFPSSLATCTCVAATDLTYERCAITPNDLRAAGDSRVSGERSAVRRMIGGWSYLSLQFFRWNGVGGGFCCRYRSCFLRCAALLFFVFVFLLCISLGGEWSWWVWTYVPGTYIDVHVCNLC